jgi:outer membrane lipoprotein-sorting protein
MKKYSMILPLLFSSVFQTFSQGQNILLQRIKEKLNLVNNYQANATMKTDVSFLRVPQANVKVYFEKPERIKIRNEKGISFVPKGAVTLSLYSIITGNNFTVIDAGSEYLFNKNVKILKIFPNDPSDNIILSTIYVDEKNSVILRAITTTKDNGTYQLDMKYGKYLQFGLRDNVLFIFNTKDYKMPKGVTFDYDNASVRSNDTGRTVNTQGKIEIDYYSYKINKGVSDEIFQ